MLILGCWVAELLSCCGAELMQQGLLWCHYMCVLLMLGCCGAVAVPLEIHSIVVSWSVL